MGAYDVAAWADARYKDSSAVFGCGFSHDLNCLCKSIVHLRCLIDMHLKHAWRLGFQGLDFHDVFLSRLFGSVIGRSGPSVEGQYFLPAGAEPIWVPVKRLALQTEVIAGALPDTDERWATATSRGMAK